MRMSISKKTTFILLLSLFLTGFFVVLNTDPASAQISCERCSNNYSFSYAEWTAVTTCDPYEGEPVTYTQNNSCTGYNCGNGTCENDGFNFETPTNCPSDCSTSTSSDMCQRCSLNEPGCWETWDNLDDSDCDAPTTPDELSSVEYSPAGCTTGEPVDRRCAEGPTCGRCSLDYPGCWAVWIDIDESGCTAPNSLNENITVVYTPAGCQSQNDFDRRCSFDKLNVNYPAIPTPGGLLDINSLYTGGNITMATIVLFIYAASIWIAGILAFMALIYAGFIFILSGGNPGKRVKAKKQFTDILWGLLIVLLVPVIMNYINPTSALLRDPNLLGVDGNDKEFQLPLFGQEGEKLNINELCESFPTATAATDITNTPSCRWSGGVVESEKNEWCDFCKDAFGESTPCGEESIYGNGTVVCGAKYEEPPIEERPPGTQELNDKCGEFENTNILINTDGSPACQWLNYDASDTNNINPPELTEIAEWGGLCENLDGRFENLFYSTIENIDQNPERERNIFSCFDLS